METTEKLTWDEAVADKIEGFEAYLQDALKNIQEVKERLIRALDKLVELSKQAYEPGMDYYGTDYLCQMGVGIELAKLDSISNPNEVIELLNKLLKDAESRIFWLKRDIEKKEVEHGTCTNA